MGENDEISRLASSIERMAVSMEKHIEDSERKWDEHMKEHRGWDAHVATVNHQLETGRKAIDAIRTDHHENITALRKELPKNPPLRTMVGFAITVFGAIIGATWNLSEKIATKADKIETVELQKQVVEATKQLDRILFKLEIAAQQQQQLQTPMRR